MSFAWPIEDVLRKLGMEAKRHGRTEWIARCPAHDDNDPSWRIKDVPHTEKHGLHKCFACGFGGTLAQLVMHVRKCDEKQAREWLESGLAPAELPSGVALNRSRARRRFQLPDEFSGGPLDTWVTPMRRYVEGRHISPWQVERWGLGYVVEGRLAGRVVIPYRDRDGEPRSYNARAIGRSDRKYLQPRPSENPDPSAVFGEQHWPRDVSNEIVVMTEGEFNALAVERALRGTWDHIFVAAQGGSDETDAMFAFKVSHFALVLVLTDSDAAGDKFAKAVDAALSRHTERVRVRLPGTLDANDAGPEVLRHEIAAAVTRGNLSG